MEKKQGIESLNISTRTCNALKKAGFCTIEDLVSEYEKNVKKIKGIRGLSKVGFEELKEALELAGYKSVLERGIENLNISIKICNILRWNGYNTIDDLLTIKFEEELRSIRGLGEKRVKEIIDALLERGYQVDFQEYDSDAQRIESLNISTETRNILEKNGYNTIDDLLTIKSEEELRSIKGLGEKRVKEIIDALWERKLVLQKKSPEEKLECKIKDLQDAYRELGKAQKRYEELLESILKEKGTTNPKIQDAEGR